MNNEGVEHMTGKKVWFIVGADAIGLAEQEVADLLLQIGAYCDL
jgi:hypothetical protein